MATAKKATKKAPKPRGYNFAAMGRKRIIVPIISAVGQAGVKALGFVVGFPFKVTKVETYCLNKAGVVTGDVKIGATSVVQAAAAFAAAATTNAPLVASLRQRYGKSTDALNFHYTTDGAGVLTNGFIIVTVEPA